jgi:hypothetical protein
MSSSAVMSPDGGDLGAHDNVIEIDGQSDRSNPYVSLIVRLYCWEIWQ